MIITFFVAADDAAATGALADGPGPGTDTATCGNFDVFFALGEWQAILDGNGNGAGGAAFVPDYPDVVASGDDTAMVLAVPPALERALVDADGPTLAATAEHWVREQAAEGQELDAELFTGVLGELAGLARTAAGTGGATYCRVG